MPTKSNGVARRLAGSSHAIDTHWGCDTLYEMPLVVSAFRIFALAGNLRFDQRFVVFLGATIALLSIANWLRFAGMASSFGDDFHWRFGDRASIVAVVYALIPFAH